MARLGDEDCSRKGRQPSYAPNFADSGGATKGARNGPRRGSGRRRGTRRDSRCENVGKCEGGFEVGSLGSGGISEAA